MKEGNGGRKQKMKTAEWIRTEREKRGMSRKELGDILGCTAEAVRLWELGKRKPGKKYVSALARIFYLGREASGETEIIRSMWNGRASEKESSADSMPEKEPDIPEKKSECSAALPG